MPESEPLMNRSVRATAAFLRSVVLYTLGFLSGMAFVKLIGADAFPYAFYGLLLILLAVFFIRRKPAG